MDKYRENAERICDEIGLTVSFARTGTSIIPDWDKWQHDRYVVTLRKGVKSVDFDFTDSAANTAARLRISLSKRNPKPDRWHKLTAYDFLACVTKQYPGTHCEFCREYDYDPDSIRGAGVYKSVCDEWFKLRSLLSESEIEKLQEIA